MRKINKVVIHHTESRGGDKEFIRYLHVDRNGWSDIGYHYIITNGKMNGSWEAGKDGEVQIGRPIEKMGAHARGSNKGTMGISLVGTFMVDKPTPKQMSSLVNFLADFCVKFDLDPLRDIVGHRDVGSTDCPGDNLYEQMPTIRAIVYGIIRHLQERRKSIKVKEED